MTLRHLFPAGQLPAKFSRVPRVVEVVDDVPRLIDGKEVDEALGRRYRFLGLDVVARLIQYDGSTDSVTFYSVELQTPRTMTREMFQRSVDGGWVTEVLT